MVNGIIFNIQRFSVHDGPGIRTTVFLKGCPLNCLWCHNPESISKNPMLGYYHKQCNFCGICAGVCSFKCHLIHDTAHTINRKTCNLCGKCVYACPKSALEIIGREVSPHEIITEVLKDRKFYENSNGGITLSGGEPMSQPEFTLEILEQAKQNGLHTCIETSGFTSLGVLKRIMPYTDLFLFDWKESDDTLHQRFTGVSHKVIYENLTKLDSMGAKTILRCPIVPFHNAREEHYLGIAALANQLRNIIEINILPYHTMGSGKCENIGCIYPLPHVPGLSATEVQKCINMIQENTSVIVKV